VTDKYYDDVIDCFVVRLVKQKKEISKENIIKELLKIERLSNFEEKRISNRIQQLAEKSFIQYIGGDCYKFV